MPYQHNDDSLRIIFAGGGTGGHIMPGAAVADALNHIDASTRCLFLSTYRDNEQHCHTALQNHETAKIPAERWDGVVQKLRFTRSCVAAGMRCTNIYRQFHPDVVVGLGGYSCVAPVIMAHMLGRRTMVFESNAIPGRVTKVLAPLVDCVQIQWKETAKHLKARKTVLTGNPIRPRLLTSDRARAQRCFMLSPHRRTLLVMGGSQGARALNTRLAQSMKILENRSTELLHRLQILHITGPDHLNSCRTHNWPSDAIYRPLGFTDRMEDVYAAADLVLCRAGGSTLAELTALGLPSLLVPYPHAKDDHQTANAKCLEDLGAAHMIPQSNLTPQHLASLIERFIRRPKWLHDMANRAYKAGEPRATHRVAEEIRALSGVDTPSSLFKHEHKRHIDRDNNSLFKAA